MTVMQDIDINADIASSERFAPFAPLTLTPIVIPPLPMRADYLPAKLEDRAEILHVRRGPSSDGAGCAPERLGRTVGERRNRNRRDRGQRLFPARRILSAHAVRIDRRRDRRRRRRRRNSRARTRRLRLLQQRPRRLCRYDRGARDHGQSRYPRGRLLRHAHRRRRQFGGSDRAGERGDPQRRRQPCRHGDGAPAGRAPSHRQDVRGEQRRSEPRLHHGRRSLRPGDA